MDEKAVSLSVVRRLPRYYRFLGELLKQDKIKISSKELSDRMGLTASQIRQDLNCFGGFGQQGLGYSVKELHQEIGGILGLLKPTPTILIGGGNLGRAIANHMDFDNRGFKLIGIFDHSKDLEGQTIKNLKIMATDKLESFCKKYKPIMAILCIPKTATEEIASILIPLGLKGFWNFSHYDLAVKHKDIIVENVHLSDSLMTLSYKLTGI